MTAADDERFGPYRLLRRLGQGGMGEVWVAFDTRREREVALKRMAGPLAADPVFAERFRREARLTARLSSPHIIPIHDFGEIDGTLFLDMRLVPGTDLAHLLGTPLPPERALEIARQVAAALDTAHATDLLHRDVKPANVLVETDPRGQDNCYLVDFGIAKLTRDAASQIGLTETGAVLGTPAYMAPELITGTEAATTRSDVYALGALLFEMLTGTRPFTARDPATLLYQHVHQAPPRPSGLHPELERYDGVLAAALAKNPAGRPASAGELAAALTDAAHSAPPRRRTSPDARTVVPGTAMGAPGGPTGDGRRRSRPAVAVAVALALVVAGVVAVLVVPRADRAPVVASAPPVASVTTAAAPVASVTTAAAPATPPSSSVPVYVPPTAAPPTSVNGVPVPLGMDPSGAPVRRLTARGATVSLTDDHSLDLDSTAPDWGLAPLAPENAATPGGPGSDDVPPGRYDLFYRYNPALGSFWIEGNDVTSEGSNFDSPGGNYATCRAGTGTTGGRSSEEVVIDPGTTWCADSDQGRRALVRLVEARPDRLVLEIIVWEPTT